MVRCERCSALVAIEDAARCFYHDTAVLCMFCWKDHVGRSVARDKRWLCAAEVGTVHWT